MPRAISTTMSQSQKITCRPWLRGLRLAAMLISTPVFAAEATKNPADTATASSVAPGDKDAIISATPMKIESADGAGAAGQLVVAPEVISADSRSDLVYTITTQPAHGQVGLSGGVEEDFFKNQTARLGYFAYRSTEGFTGEDSFAYTVRNETTGLVFKTRSS